MKNSLRLLVQGIRRINLDGINEERNNKMLDEQKRLFWGDVSNVEEILRQNDHTKVSQKFKFLLLWDLKGQSLLKLKFLRTPTNRFEHTT